MDDSFSLKIARGARPILIFWWCLASGMAALAVCADEIPTPQVTGRCRRALVIGVHLETKRGWPDRQLFSFLVLLSEGFAGFKQIFRVMQKKTVAIASCFVIHYCLSPRGWFERTGAWAAKRFEKSCCFLSEKMIRCDLVTTKYK
ncbi:hypothetical protein [Paenibacillus ginsengihumi]|uniref:hypothetical protein n=1 Tax=Paenibacillus ginsengihumi TaxID=431596 RepID=UPI000378BFA4|nr:hypothetical protein [Paenibacillus ginsengihumi]